MYSIYILYTCISLWYNYDPKMKERMNKQGLGHRSVAVVFVDGRSEVGVHATHQPSHRKSTSYIILMVLYKMPSKCICIYIYMIYTVYTWDIIVLLSKILACDILTYLFLIYDTFQSNLRLLWICYTYPRCVDQIC